MTLREYFIARESWLRGKRHPKTVNETRVAVEAFCEWFGGDIDIDDMTPTLAEQFEAAEETTRRRQLASNLLGLLRLYDPKSFPRRSKSLLANARYEEVASSPTATNGKPATLAEFARLYVARRSISAGYANTLKVRAAKFQEFVGKSAIAEVMTEATVNSFLASIVGQGSPYTVRKWRQDLLTLWSAAADDDLVAYPIRRRIRREKVEAVVPECYTPDEVRALVAAAETLKGAYDNGVAKRHYWPALLRFSWDSGLRRGDCWRFDKACLKDDGSFRVVQSKTRKAVMRRLRPETIAALNKIDSQRPLEWPLSHEWSFGMQFQRLVALAGLDKGTFKWLRRGCGSHVEAEHPGGGCKALGNTEQVFRSNYDAQLSTDIFMPPAL